MEKEAVIDIDNHKGEDFMVGLSSIHQGQPRCDAEHAITTCQLFSSLPRDPCSRKDDRTASTKDTAGLITAAAKFAVGMVACTTARSSTMTNAMDFVAWRWRGCYKAVLLLAGGSLFQAGRQSSGCKGHGKVCHCRCQICHWYYRSHHGWQQRPAELPWTSLLRGREIVTTLLLY
jgi:hypothetical protein